MKVVDGKVKGGVEVGVLQGDLGLPVQQELNGVHVTSCACVVECGVLGVNINDPMAAIEVLH